MCQSWGGGLGVRLARFVTQAIQACPKCLFAVGLCDCTATIEGCTIMSPLYLKLHRHNHTQHTFTFGAVDEWWNTRSLDAHLHLASQTEGMVTKANGGRIYFQSKKVSHQQDPEFECSNKLPLDFKCFFSCGSCVLKINFLKILFCVLGRFYSISVSSTLFFIIQSLHTQIHA